MDAYHRREGERERGREGERERGREGERRREGENLSRQTGSSRDQVNIAHYIGTLCFQSPALA